MFSGFWSFFTTGVSSLILYPSFIISIVLIIVCILWRKIVHKLKCVLWILLLEYLFVVVCSTIICRGAMSFEFDRLELTPFWTYKAVISHTPGVRVWDIVLNVVLFVPLGFLVELLYPSISVLKMLGIALLCSLFIETSQFVFEKGIAQTDDMMHNVIGAALGWLLAKITLKVISKQKHNT